MRITSTLIVVAKAVRDGLGKLVKWAAMAAAAAAAAVAAFVFITWDETHCVARLKVQRIKEHWLGPWPPTQEEYVCVEGDILKKKKDVRTVAVRTSPTPVANPDMCDPNSNLLLQCHINSLYRYFNAKLFQNRLRPVVLTVREMPGAVGYFASRRFYDGKGGSRPEIAIAVSRREATWLHIATTVVHEQVHQLIWQTGRQTSVAHNRAWVDEMRRVGLVASATGRPGGAQIGQRITQYILVGGLFDRVASAHPLVRQKKLAWKAHDPAIRKRKRPNGRFK